MAKLVCRRHSIAGATLMQALSAVVLAGFATASSPDQAAAEVRWVMATEYPRTNISGVGLATFGQLVAERTDGFVTTTNAFDNAAMVSSGEMIEAAQERRITGGDAFAGPLEEIDPIFGLASLPFVVQSIEAAKAVNAKARPLYEKALAGRGLKLLYITIWPSTGIWSARPLDGPDDLRTLVVRAYDQKSAEVMRAAGARAEYLPFDRAVAKVRAREINAILTSGDGGAGSRMWDDLRYFSAINYAMPVSLAFVRTEVFDELSPARQTQVLAAAAETEASQWELVAHRTADNYARMRENGVQIVDPASPSVVVALKHAAEGAIAGWKRKVMPEAVAVLEASAR